MSVLLALEEEPWNGILIIIWSLIYSSCLNVCIEKVFDLKYVARFIAIPKPEQTIFTAIVLQTDFSPYWPNQFPKLSFSFSWFVTRVAFSQSIKGLIFLAMVYFQDSVVELWNNDNCIT